jgi:hypothetical protein
VLFAVLLDPANSQAQVFTWTREQMLKYTAQNPYERFPDGRPKVPDSILQKVMGLSAEEVLAIASRGYPNQFVEGMQVLHPGKKLVGRALTLQLMPLRADVAEAQAAEWKAKGGTRFSHQTAIDISAGDVFIGRSGYRVRDHRRQPGLLYLEDDGSRLVIDGAIRDLKALQPSTWRVLQRAAPRRSETSW